MTKLNSILLFLIAVTLALYFQTKNFDFINFDDDIYITKNPHIQNGISPETLRWAFEADLIKKTEHLDYWQPVTVISRLVDIELFGLNASGHHLVNAFLHLLNVALLFLLFFKSTNALWKSTLLALLFAIHPIQAEAVAWVTSRKDMLGAFFGLLSLFSYQAWTNKKTNNLFVWSLVLFLLSTLSKPLFITLPILMLLFDYWPLGRNQSVTFKARLIEKIPFFVLSLLISCVFIISQSQDTMNYLPYYKVGLKAVVSYADYLKIFLDPFHLGIRNINFEEFFDHTKIGVNVLILCFLVLVLIKTCKKLPYVFFGLGWFLISLYPSVLISMMADRFLYIPLIGLLVCLIWGSEQLFEKLRISKNILIGCFSIVTLFLFCLSWIQIGYWKDSERVFRQSLRLSKNNPLALNNLGTILIERKEYAEAKKLFTHSIRLQPEYVKPLYNLAYLSALEGKKDEAINYYKLVVEIDPRYAEAYNDLGTVLISQNRLDEALVSIKKALEIKPIPKAYNNMGFILEKKGEWKEAATYYNKALSLDPNNPEAHNNVGIALARDGNLEASVQHFEEALRLKPDHPEARQNIVTILTRLGREAEARMYGRDLKTDDSSKANVGSYS